MLLKTMDDKLTDKILAQHQKKAPGKAVKALIGAVATTYVVTPLHELLHEMAAIVGGGQAGPISIASDYSFLKPMIDLTNGAIGVDGQADECGASGLAYLSLNPAIEGLHDVFIDILPNFVISAAGFYMLKQGIREKSVTKSIYGGWLSYLGINPLSVLNKNDFYLAAHALMNLYPDICADDKTQTLPQNIVAPLQISLWAGTMFAAYLTARTAENKLSRDTELPRLLSLLEKDLERENIKTKVAREKRFGGLTHTIQSIEYELNSVKYSLEQKNGKLLMRCGNAAVEFKKGDITEILTDADVAVDVGIRKMLENEYELIMRYR